ncbi:MAG: helix-turn-helix transcriptional regulator [Cyclobacteriaceae bacterium]
MNYHEQIKAARKAQKLTRPALAEKAGVSVPMLKIIENGTANPSIKVLTQIVEALGGRLDVKINGLK